jgi:hypothetical protein
VNIAAEEMHKINPAIEVLAWDYNVDFRPSAVELKRYVIGRYSSDVIPFVTWENGKGFECDGEHGYLKDYAINEVGPADVSAAQIGEPKQIPRPRTKSRPLPYSAFWGRGNRGLCSAAIKPIATASINALSLR